MIGNPEKKFSARTIAPQEIAKTSDAGQVLSGFSRYLDLGFEETDQNQRFGSSWWWTEHRWGTVCVPCSFWLQW